MVMEEAGAVVGFGGYKDRYISWLFVHPAHRRKGVARALLAEILGRLDGPVTPNVCRNNPAARSLYEGFGFVVDKEFVGIYNGHECQAMTLTKS